MRPSKPRASKPKARCTSASSFFQWHRTSSKNAADILDGQYTADPAPRAARRPFGRAGYAGRLRSPVQQAARLNQLITTLLDISRIEAGQLTIRASTARYARADTARGREIQPALDGHTLSLSCPDAPLVVEGDGLRLEQVRKI